MAAFGGKCRKLTRKKLIIFSFLVLKRVYKTDYRQILILELLYTRRFMLLVSGIILLKKIIKVSITCNGFVRTKRHAVQMWPA